MKLNNSLYFLLAAIAGLFICACQPESKPNTKAVAPVISPEDSPSEIIQKLTAKIQENPNNHALYANRGNAYYQGQSYDEAIADLEKALSIDSTQVPYLHLLADVYLDYYKSRKALETMQKAVQLNPDSINSLLKLSEFQLILRQHKESANTVTTILQKDQQNAEAYFMMGRILEETGDTSRAINSYQTAVEQDPDLTEVWLKLGNLFALKGNNIALRYFDSAIRNDETNILAHFYKATYLHNDSKLNEAIEIYKKISTIDPQFADAYYNSGLAYMEMDSVEKANVQFDLTVKMQPTHYMGYFYRGFSHEVLNNPAAARNDYKQALNLNPSFERAQQALEGLK